jgi:hypothetical protein
MFAARANPGGQVNLTPTFETRLIQPGPLESEKMERKFHCDSRVTNSFHPTLASA